MICLFGEKVVSPSGLDGKELSGHTTLPAFDNGAVFGRILINGAKAPPGMSHVNRAGAPVRNFKSPGETMNMAICLFANSFNAPPCFAFRCVLREGNDFTHSVCHRDSGDRPRSSGP